ncbi:MAG: helix-turn-helix domain-containing protein [Planctomycetaceae bacterium]
MNETFLTVEGAANYLQVSRSIIYALIEAGKLACHRIGLGRGTIRISQHDIEAYLESCRQGDVTPPPPLPPPQKLKHIRL